MNTRHPTLSINSDNSLFGSARSLFPHTRQGKIYLNHAGTSPLSTRVVNAMTEYLRERSEGRLETYQHDLPMVTECKSFIQRIINAESADRIALTANTSDAINIVASGVSWKAGDRVLLNTAEFPANIWPYLNLRRLGMEIDFIQSPDGRVTLDMIERALTPHTRLLALSAVQFLSGYRADLAALGDLCRQRNIIFAVDAIQTVGAVRVDVQQMKIDALMAGGQKWQMSPHGTGFLYLTAELQDRIQQASLGWLAVQDPWNFHDYGQPVASTARRYEGGSSIMPSLWGMHAALGTILDVGLDAIETQVLTLTGILIKGFHSIDGLSIVTPEKASERAGIVTITLPKGQDERELFKSLLSRNITPALREGMLRFSPHFYMTEEEMNIVTDAMREYLRQAQC